MALTTVENWKLTTYTNDTWTTLITGNPSVISSLVICNTTNLAIDVSVQLDGCLIVSNASIASYSTQTLDLRSLVIKTTQTLQVKASAAGINFHASGAV